MTFIRHTFCAGLVWLTAVATLTAGLPHFQCRCPDGRSKAVCDARPEAAGSGCSCCRAAAASQAPRHSCCKTVPAKRPTSHEVRAGSCTRTLAAPEALALFGTPSATDLDGQMPSPAVLTPVTVNA